MDIGTLNNITIGTVVTWGGIVLTAITAVGSGAIKLYKLFEKTHKIKEENDEFKMLVQNHEEQLKEVMDVVKDIQASFAEQKEVNLKQTRHTIVNVCEDAIADGKITAYKLRSLEEMYDEYIDVFHGNGYVKTLMNKVRKLKVIGEVEDYSH